MIRRTTFCDRPARGGSITQTSGLPASSTRSRIASRMSPAKKRALVISLRRALSIASATAGSTISTPITSRARLGEREADRADAAVEVEDPLVARAARRARPRRRRAPRPSRCSSGRTPPARSGTRGRRAARAAAWIRDPRFVSPPWVLSPTPAACVQNRPSQSTAAARLSASIAPGRGDEPHLQLAGAPALAHDEVAQQAALVAPVPGRQPLLARPERAPARGRRCRARRRAGSRRAGRSGRSGRARGSRTRARRRGPVPNEYSSLLR